MKPIIVTTLLLALGACVKPSQAAATYTPSVVLSSPKNGTPYVVTVVGGQTRPTPIPITVSDQYVEIDGATPLVYVSVPYGMYVSIQYYSQSQGGPPPNVLGYDYSGTNVQELPDAKGHWLRWAAYSNQGSYSPTATAGNGFQGQPYTITVTGSSSIGSPFNPSQVQIKSQNPVSIVYMS